MDSAHSEPPLAEHSAREEPPYEHSSDEHSSPGHTSPGHHRSAPIDPALTPSEFWEDRYQQSDSIWSGNPNPVLVREASALNPGRALDLGCGEGADAIWLARQGWRVTAVDISTTALDRGRLAAEAAGVAERIDWQRHELGETFPAGEFDLVSAQFLQSPVQLDRERIFRAAAGAVAPGGSLLIVGHAEFPPWASGPALTVALPDASEVLASIDLDDAEWEPMLVATESRPVTAPDGSAATLLDSVVFVRRH